MRPSHDTSEAGWQCWCRPTINRVCDDCADNEPPGCWKCDAGLIRITQAQASVANEPLVIIHGEG